MQVRISRGQDESNGVPLAQSNKVHDKDERKGISAAAHSKREFGTGLHQGRAE